jgi:hypothetical protein
MLRRLGGAFAREPRHRSALCHREAGYSLATIGALMPEIAEAVFGARPGGAGGVGALVDGRAAAELRGIGRSGPGGQGVHRGHPALAGGLGDRYDPAGVFRVSQVVRSSPS